MTDPNQFDLDRLLSRLGSDNAIATAGFCYGFSQVVDSDFLDSPLTTTMAGVLQGSLYVLGASIVGSYVPSNFRFMLPLVLGLAIIKQQMDRQSPKPQHGAFGLCNDCGFRHTDNVSGYRRGPRGPKGPISPEGWTGPTGDCCRSFAEQSEANSA